MKFPLYVFNPGHGMTLNHRTADFSRYLIEKRLPRLQVTLPSEPAPYIYRTLICEANLKMGLVSLASLAACARKWPKIEMCVDESISPEAVKRFYGSHGIPVEVWTPAALVERLNDHQEVLLGRFAESYFWGRKTAFTFATHEPVPILYCDLDVLWFQDPWTGLNLSAVDSLLAAEDKVFSYNSEFLKILLPEHRDRLLADSPYCAGLYVVPPGFKLPDEVLGYLSEKMKSAPPGFHYEKVRAIEQTLLGLATRLVGRGIPWEKLPTCPEELWSAPAFRHKNWIAAHYAGPTRRQFWRDAWSLFRQLGSQV